MQYRFHHVDASVAGLPDTGFTTTEAHGDIGCKHVWIWKQT